MNQAEFVAELAKLRTSSTFLNLHRYTNASGEIADFNIIFHMSYENALKRSINILERVIPDSDLQSQAKAECLTSFVESLKKIDEVAVEDIDDAYLRFFNDDQSYIKGVKLHAESATLHLYGLVHQKRVIVPGVYKTVNSRPLTIEKDKLRRLTPVSKFRQFKITPEQVDRIAVQGLSLLPPES